MKNKAFSMTLDMQSKSDERITLTTVESFGRDMDDLLANATVGREDWNGNEIYQIDLGDLDSETYDAIVQEMTKYLAGA